MRRPVAAGAFDERGFSRQACAMAGDALARFAAELGSELFSADPAGLVCHAYDATNEFIVPAGVVRPRTAAEVGEVVAAANRHGVPIVPRGAGTGFSGGALAVRGGVVLDLQGLNRVLDLDETALTVRVEPGVVTLHLQDLVEARGLYYPPDPASSKICTIGGNVAENAGGPHCVKYGVTRDYVLVIDGFTGDGRPLRAGKPTLKNRAGYNLKDLLIGSEGTLGVFTSFLLRLVPKPESALLFAAFFPDLDTATGMVNTLWHAGIAPASLEFMDEAALRAVERHAPFGLPLQYQALLLIEVDGRADEMAALRQRVEGCLRGVAGEVRVAATAAERTALWEIRRKASPAMRAFGTKKANEDIVVPRQHIPATMRGLRAIADRHALTIISFGHIGDGNIHVNIMYDADDPAESARVPVAIQDVFDLVGRFDGAVSGEHGIGLAKKPYLPRNLDPVSYDLMRSVKRIFDPNGVLNPHKMVY